MRRLFTLLTLSFLSFISFGQLPKVTADTFVYARMFSIKKIVIRSDSTYILRETGCTSSSLNMGFWTRKKDTLLLSGLFNSIVTAKTEISAFDSTDDSLIIFKVQDCYGNPLSKYHINFFAKDLSFDTSYVGYDITNKEGILKLPQGKFAFYNTESDESNSEDNQGYYNDIIYRPILQKAKTIIITLSFPKKIIHDTWGDSLYKYKLRKFKLSGKQLLDIRSGYQYLKK
jgi:hypothetical protein